MYIYKQYYKHNIINLYDCTSANMMCTATYIHIKHVNGLFNNKNYRHTIQYLLLLYRLYYYICIYVIDIDIIYTYTYVLTL